MKTAVAFAVGLVALPLAVHAADDVAAPGTLADVFAQIYAPHRGAIPTATTVLVWLREDGTFQELEKQFYNGVNTISQPVASGEFSYVVSSGEPDVATLSLGLQPFSLRFTNGYTGSVSDDPTGEFTLFAVMPGGGAENVSNRCWIEPQRAAITGFVIGGSLRRWVLLRAVGPTLAAHGVPAPVMQPELTLFPETGDETSYHAWTADPNRVVGLQTVFDICGAFPFESDSADCAALVLLAPGPYTMHATGATSEAEVLLEVYVLDHAAPVEP